MNFGSRRRSSSRRTSLGCVDRAVAVELAVICLAGIEQQQGVAGRRGIEYDKALCTLADFASEGTKDGDFLGAGRAQVFFEQGATGSVHLRPDGGEHVIDLDVAELLNGVDLAGSRCCSDEKVGADTPLRLFYSYSTRTRYFATSWETT